MVPLNDPFPKTSNALIAQLKRGIENVNRRGDLAGLASFYFLRENSASAIKWNVFIPTHEWLQQHANELDQAPQLAILGYLMFEERRNNSSELSLGRAEFTTHVQRLGERQNIFTTLNSWILQPTIVLGITLGVLVCDDDLAKQWLQARFSEGLQRTDVSLYLQLFYRYGLSLLQAPSKLLVPFQLPPLDANTATLPERACTIWMTQREILKPPSIKAETWLADAQADLLERCLLEELDSLVDEKAGLILQVLTTYIYARSRLPSLDLIQMLLTNFVPAMERWKRQWKITDEYDIQAILWLILRTAFDDVRYEEYLPKRGRSGHRYDIGIPALGLLVEAKYIYKSNEFQKIVDEIGKDAAQITTQKAFTGFFVFVYDSSRSNQHHDWASKAILDTERIKGCIIVSAPSHLPATKRRIRKPLKSTVRSKKKTKATKTHSG